MSIQFININIKTNIFFLFKFAMLIETAVTIA